MNREIFKLSIFDHIKSVLTKTIFITFVVTLFFAITAGEPAMGISLFNVILIGASVYEYANKITVSIFMDGVRIARGSKQREIKFEIYKISSTVHGKLTIVDRRSAKKDTVVCGGFNKKLFGEMMTAISKRQTEYYLRRNASGEFSSSAKINKSSKETASDASKRNPYSKSDPPKSDANPIPQKIQTIANDIVAIGTAAISTTPIKNKNAKVEKIESEPARKNESESTLVPDNASSEAESLTRHDFHYPRRDIVEKVEMANIMTALCGALIIVAVFLIWYITIGAFKGGVIAFACALLAIGAITITAIIVKRKLQLGKLFSKIEITDNYLIIDNSRYRFADMTEMKITSPESNDGIRKLSFAYDGRRVVYSLGKATQSSDKRDIQSFPRYRELCRLLKQKGFKLC